ncbi:AfsR/SARP family transcriptional regulator [Glycomyces albidus]|nr:BTAD domain-containing putative transcriptional regulator [Glycomyces albidus]
MPTLDVRLLGPLEVRIDGAEVAVPRGKTATILAILLDDANSVVPLDSLIRAVYGIDLPKDPDTQIQNAVGVLRTKLGAARERIETVGRAYRLRIAPGELDLLRCKQNEDRARSLRLEGRIEEAAAAMRAALAEWRGPALADQAGAAVESIRRRYDEHRLALLERRLDLDLELGRHSEVVDELRQVAAAYGTRQRLTALLMRALHASGRTAEALEAYAALKDRLADALGADPDQELVALHTAILRDRPAAVLERPVEPPAPVRVPWLAPATLPRAITRFTGRETEIRLLDDALEASEDEAGLAVVTGMGGVGKTALAVRWAHRVAHRFPDGQLYFNLRGFDPLSDGADPAAVLAEALVALGVPVQHLPAGLDQRVSLYRTVIARRRILVVLDNARDAAQVRPLLPVAPGSFTLVTSRDRLSGLDAGDGADVVALNLMSEADAWALLVRRIGRTRAMAEEEPVRRIVAACGRLPLALTLLGAWAARHPDFSLASLADRLEQTTNVFKVLAAADLASDPRSVFACSYQVLGTRAAQAFRLFGLHPGPEVTPAAMASLMGGSVAEAEAALGELAEVHLAEQPREGRYAMHDLLRAYAKERLTEEVAPERRTAAADRVVAYYIHSARAADRLLTLNGEGIDPGGPGDGVHPEPLADAHAALAWFETEYPVLFDLVVRPGAVADAAAWRLAWSLAEYMVMRALSADLHAAQTAALAAAERTGDLLGQVVAHGYIGAAAILAGDKEGAERRLEEADRLADASGQPWAKGFTEYGRAALAAKSGEDAPALAHCRNALEHFRRSGERFWSYRALAGIGWHSAALGEFAEARRCFDDLADAVRDSDNPLAIGNARLGLGFIDHLQGRHDAALAHYAEAERILVAGGNLPTAAFARELTGDARMAAGAAAAARNDWRAAEAVYSEFGCVFELARVRARLAGPVEDAAAEDGLIVVAPGAAHERVEAAVREALHAFGYRVREAEPSNDEAVR